MKIPIRELASTIKRLHGRDGYSCETVPVKEEFNGKVIWQGDVDVFDLTGNKLATRAYAWMHGLDDTQAKRHVTVLHVPPIDSP
jgi:hypothetical protein